MGIVCADYDNDGDTDIIVGNDAMANFVWRNDGKGHFEEVGCPLDWLMTETVSAWALWGWKVATMIMTGNSISS
jgi:hypothetical protein